MEVLLGGAEAAVAETLLDDLEVGAAGEEPGRVGMPEVVDAHVDHQVRLLQRGPPDALPEPARRDMPVRVTRSQSARIVLAVGASLGPVAAVSVPAIVTAAAAQRVAGESAVPVAAPGSVRLGAAQSVEVGVETRRPNPRPLLNRHLEQQIVPPELMLRDMGPQLGGDLGA